MTDTCSTGLADQRFGGSTAKTELGVVFDCPPDSVIGSGVHGEVELCTVTVRDLDTKTKQNVSRLYNIYEAQV